MAGASDRVGTHGASRSQPWLSTSVGSGARLTIFAPGHRQVRVESRALPSRMGVGAEGVARRGSPLAPQRETRTPPLRRDRTGRGKARSAGRRQQIRVGLMLGRLGISSPETRDHRCPATRGQAITAPRLVQPEIEGRSRLVTRAISAWAVEVLSGCEPYPSRENGEPGSQC